MEPDNHPRQTPAESTQRERLKPANVLFFSFFLIIIFCQTFYWLFANQLDPILVGMPFGLFFITAMIVLEFIGLIILYKYQER